MKSENQIDILTDVDSLVRSDGVIEGRYGEPAVIGQVPGAIPPSWSLINVGPSIGGFRQVDVPFDFDCAALPHYTSAAGGIRMPLVLVEDTVVSDRGNINCNAAGTKGVVGVRVADSLIAGKAPLLQVIFPFWPRAWNYAETLVDVPAVFILERISAEKDSFILRSVTANTFGLAPDQADVDAAIAKLNVELKKAADARVAEEKKNSTQKQSKPASTEPPSVKQPTFDANCITLLYAPGKGMNLPSKDCKDHDPRAAYLSQFSILISSLPDDGKDAFKDRFILLDRKRRAFEVPVPASKPKPKDPALDKTTKITVNQFDTGWISFPGSDLAGIKSAKVTGVALDTRIVPKTAKLPENVQVNLIRTVTDKPGANSVTFYDSDGKFVDTLSFTIRCTACAAAAAKPN